MLWLLRRNGYESAIRSGVTWVRLRCSRRRQPAKTLRWGHASGSGKQSDMSKLPDNAGLIVMAFFAAAGVFGVLGWVASLGGAQVPSLNGMLSGGLKATGVVIGLVVGLSLLAGLGYVAWLLLRGGVRTLSKDVRAGSEEAKLESDILRARLAELEQRLDKRDAGDEES